MISSAGGLSSGIYARCRQQYSIRRLCALPRPNQLQKWDERVKQSEARMRPKQVAALSSKQLCTSRHVAAYAEQPDASSYPSEQEMQEEEEQWRSRPPAVTLPKSLSRPAQWLLFAGFLKTMILCATNYSLLAGFLHPTGPRVLLVMLAFGAGLAKLAQAIERSGILKRPWIARATLTGFVLLLIASNAVLA